MVSMTGYRKAYQLDIPMQWQWQWRWLRRWWWWAASGSSSERDTERLWYGYRICPEGDGKWQPSVQNSITKDSRDNYQVVLATSPGNKPAVGVMTSGSVRFGSRPGQIPDHLCLGGFVTQRRHRTARSWPGWNWTAVPNIWLLLLCLQLSIWVLIISQHDQYIDCAVVVALSPSAFKFAIRLIFVEWLWNNGGFWTKLVGFRSPLNEYLSDRKCESGRWKSD